MTRHFNTSIVENAARILNSKQGDYLPDQVQGPVAVIPIVHCVNIARAVNIANDASEVVWTTPSDKDFYLVAANIGVSKDATATSQVTALSVVINGVTTNILHIPTQATTVESETTGNNYPVPVKLDRNTAITLTNTTAVSGIRATAAILGYTVETTK